MENYSIRNGIINIIIKGYNGITKIIYDNNKLFDFLGLKLGNSSDMKLNHGELMKNLYYNNYQNPPGVFSLAKNIVGKLVWRILTYNYNKDEFY